MRVAFYDSGYETFGVQYLLSTLSAQGYDVRLFFDSSFSKDYLAQDFFLTGLLSLSPEQVSRNLLALEPDVACFSLYTIFYQDNLAAVRLMKEEKPDLMVVCGGFHASLLPAKVLAHEQIDFVVLGEAETSLPSLLNALGKSPIDEVKALPADALPGVWNLHCGEVMDRGLSPIPHDLDEMPFPEKQMYYDANPALASMYTAIGSRGCPYACTYCNSATMNTLYRGYGERYYRVRSVENVIAELKEAKARFKPKHVMFFDDVFGAKREWLREFSARYKAEVGLPYFCQTSPLIHDKESLALLADSGCVLLEFGFQSANARVRGGVLNRRETNDSMQELLLEAIRLGMFTELDLIANLPGETPEHLEEALDFVRATRPKWVNLSFLQFHPKTPITDTAVAEGMLTPEDVGRIEEGLHASSMRLLSKSSLGKRYRVLPFQVFFAFYLPPRLSKGFIRWAEKPILSGLCSFFASWFLYFSRILLSYTDKRDFLVRHHVVRSIRAARWVLARKVFGVARH